MAQKMVTVIKNFIGLHSDTKPASSSVPNGAKFHSVDTDEYWIFLDSMWERIGVDEFMETALM